MRMGTRLRRVRSCVVFAQVLLPFMLVSLMLPCPGQSQIIQTPVVQQQVSSSAEGCDSHNSDIDGCMSINVHSGSEAVPAVTEVTAMTGSLPSSPPSSLLTPPALDVNDDETDNQDREKVSDPIIVFENENIVCIERISPDPASAAALILAPTTSYPAADVTDNTKTENMNDNTIPGSNMAIVSSADTSSSSSSWPTTRECYPKMFVATTEFQPVRPGQMLPRGVHARINLHTGLREAKMSESSEHNSDDRHPTSTSGLPSGGGGTGGTEVASFTPGDQDPKSYLVSSSQRSLVTHASSSSTTTKTSITRSQQSTKSPESKSGSRAISSNSFQHAQMESTDIAAALRQWREELPKNALLEQRQFGDAIEHFLALTDPDMFTSDLHPSPESPFFTSTSSTSPPSSKASRAQDERQRHRLDDLMAVLEVLENLAHGYKYGWELVSMHDGLVFLKLLDMFVTGDDDVAISINTGGSDSSTSSSSSASTPATSDPWPLTQRRVADHDSGDDNSNMYTGGHKKTGARAQLRETFPADIRCLAATVMAAALHNNAEAQQLADKTGVVVPLLVHQLSTAARSLSIARTAAAAAAAAAAPHHVPVTTTATTSTTTHHHPNSYTHNTHAHHTDSDTVDTAGIDSEEDKDYAVHRIHKSLLFLLSSLVSASDTTAASFLRLAGPRHLLTFAAASDALPVHRRITIIVEGLVQRFVHVRQRAKSGSTPGSHHHSHQGLKGHQGQVLVEVGQINSVRGRDGKDHAGVEDGQRVRVRYAVRRPDGTYDYESATDQATATATESIKSPGIHTPVETRHDPALQQHINSGVVSSGPDTGARTQSQSQSHLHPHVHHDAHDAFFPLDTDQTILSTWTDRDEWCTFFATFLYDAISASFFDGVEVAADALLRTRFDCQNEIMVNGNKGGFEAGSVVGSSKSNVRETTVTAAAAGASRSAKVTTSSGKGRDRFSAPRHSSSSSSRTTPVATLTQRMTAGQNLSPHGMMLVYSCRAWTKIHGHRKNSQDEHSEPRHHKNTYVGDGDYLADLDVAMRQFFVDMNVC